MTSSRRYPEVSVSGSPAQMGEQIGEACREAIRGFAEVAIDRVRKTINVSRESALVAAETLLPLARDYSSDSIDELVGMARASGLSLAEIMMLQIRNQLVAQSPSEGCTSISFGRPFCTERVFGQNWDADSALDPFTVVLTRRPEGKPAFTTLTQAGLIAYIGGNSLGMGVCLNALPAPTRYLPERGIQAAWGVPHYFTVRGIYESTSLSEAVRAVERAERAIPASILVTAPEGTANLEVMIDSVHVQHESEVGILSHTNHCTNSALLAVNDQYPDLIQSRDRLRRVEQLVGTAAVPPLSGEQGVAELQRIFSDHQDAPRGICRHANDDPNHGFWSTVFSVIVRPAARQMWVSRGCPCEAPYELYEIA